jgi:hypothetical protein
LRLDSACLTDDGLPFGFKGGFFVGQSFEGSGQFLLLFKVGEDRFERFLRRGQLFLSGGFHEISPVFEWVKKCQTLNDYGGRPLL